PIDLTKATRMCRIQQGMFASRKKRKASPQPQGESAAPTALEARSPVKEQSVQEQTKESGMSQSSTDAPSNDTAANSPLAQVFQDAYQKAVLIKRLDDQVLQIIQRRKQLCDELKSIQSQLNDEFT